MNFENLIVYLQSFIKFILQNLLDWSGLVTQTLQVTLIQITYICDLTMLNYAADQGTDWSKNEYEKF